ncbi:MAG: hypothetical protein U9Q37_00155 [Euryarchaeota archaeon]|nr:hypothetical protein [Euryarchaeota archaeon]
MEDNELICKHCQKRFKNLHGLQIHLGKARKKAGSLDELRKIDEEIVRVTKAWREIWAEMKVKQ